MVLPVLIAGGLVLVVLMFRDQIKGFIDDQRDNSKDPEKIAKQEAQDKKGALGNTELFIFGEEFVKQKEANQIAFNEAVTNLQGQIDTSIKGVNTSLAQSQKDLEQFAKTSQEQIAKTGSDIQKNIDTGIKGAQGNFDQFVKDSQTNIDTLGKGASDFFGNIFNNPFGGQKNQKPITTQTPTSTQTPKVTQTPKGSPDVDLSFLTPNTSFGSPKPDVITSADKIRTLSDARSRN